MAVFVIFGVTFVSLWGQKCAKISKNTYRMMLNSRQLKSMGEILQR